MDPTPEGNIRRNFQNGQSVQRNAAEEIRAEPGSAWMQMEKWLV